MKVFILILSSMFVGTAFAQEPPTLVTAYVSTYIETTVGKLEVVTEFGLDQHSQFRRDECDPEGSHEEHWLAGNVQGEAGPRHMDVMDAETKEHLTLIGTRSNERSKRELATLFVSRDPTNFSHAEIAASVPISPEQFIYQLPAPLSDEAIVIGVFPGQSRNELRWYAAPISTQNEPNTLSVSEMYKTRISEGAVNLGQIKNVESGSIPSSYHLCDQE